MPTGTIGVFDRGDLFFLNKKGKEMFSEIRGDHGIILTDRYLLYEKIDKPKEERVQYYAYDILVKGKLFKKIPEDFLKRIVENEEAPE